MEPAKGAISVDETRVGLLLKWMIDGSKTLTPSIENEVITYPDLTKMISTENPIELLEQLSARGFLKKEYFQSEVLCSACGSSSLKDRYACTYCNGNRLETGEMIEHYPCGNVDFEANFLKDGKLICPKCEKELKIIGTDYRRVGKVFKCMDCGRESSIPKIIHVCQDCGTASTWEKVQLRILFEYRINEDKKKEIEALVGIHNPLLAFLRDRGFKIESPGFLKGGSGIEHSFDIVAIVDGNQTLFDIRTAKGAVDENAIIAFFAKAMDVPHVDAILVASPKASERAKGIARLYGIGIVEGSSINEVIASMAARSLGKPTAPKGPAEQATPAVAFVAAQVLAKPTAPIESVQTTVAPTVPSMQDIISKLAKEGNAQPRVEIPPKGETSDTQLKTPIPEERPKENSALTDLRALRSRMFMLKKTEGKPSEEKIIEETKVIRSNLEDRPLQVEGIPTTSIAPEVRVMEDKRLLELERLYAEKKIGEEEYLANKNRIMKGQV